MRNSAGDVEEFAPSRVHHQKAPSIPKRKKIMNEDTLCMPFAAQNVFSFLFSLSPPPLAFHGRLAVPYLEQS
jgi:hypothetical protein